MQFFLRSPSHLQKISVGGATETKWTDIVWTETVWTETVWTETVWTETVWTETVWTEAVWTDNCSRIVRYFLTLRIGVSLNTAATNTEHGKHMCRHISGQHRTRQAHVSAHLWPTQNTATTCVGTPVAYTEQGKRICWHTCGQHRTRQAHVSAHL